MTPAIKPMVGIGDESQSVSLKRGPLLIRLIIQYIATANDMKLTNCQDLKNRKITLVYQN